MMSTRIDGVTMELVNATESYATIRFICGKSNPFTAAIVKLDKDTIDTLSKKSKRCYCGRTDRSEQFFSVEAHGRAKSKRMCSNGIVEEITDYKYPFNVDYIEVRFASIFSISASYFYEKSENDKISGFDYLISMILNSEIKRNKFNKFFEEVKDVMI